MMETRWRGTRARLQNVSPSVEAPALWDRIAASRTAGASIDLHARDPRRLVAPVLLGVLLAMGIAGGITLVRRIAPVRVDTTAVPAADPEASALLQWLPTPAHAQGIAPSALPPIDPPDLTRLTPRMLVYLNERTAGGEVTDLGVDTISIARDTQEHLERVAVISTGRGGSVSTIQAIDSLVLASDGRFLFWHGQVRHFGTDRMTRVSTTLRTDSLTITFWRSGGRPIPPPLTSPANTGQYVRAPLIAMLPSLPLREGYARSLSGLDLVRGTTTPGFARSVELRVVGTQWITVPAGRFHCWTVEFKAVYLPGDKPDQGRLWVDMASGSLIRGVWDESDGFFEEQVLIKQEGLN